MHTVVFTPAARFEMFEAGDWYETESSGLGGRFLLDVNATIMRIAKNPLQFPVMHKHVRRALLEKFPYALMYVIKAGKRVSIICCFHGSRNPVRWQERV